MLKKWVRSTSFLTPNDASEWDIIHIKNNQLIILFIIYLINIIIFNFLSISAEWKKKVVPIWRQEMKVKVDIVTSDDIKIYYTGKFKDFTARYIINVIITFKKEMFTRLNPTTSTERGVNYIFSEISGYWESYICF